MMRKALILLLLMGISFLSGCWDVQEISKRGIANAVFFDVENGGQLKMGVVLSIPGTEMPPIVGTTQQFEKRNYVITGEGDSFVEAWTEIQATTVRNIFFGQTRAVILSEKLARENINDILDFVGRIPLIPPNTRVLITRDDLVELMEMQNRDNYTPGNYIDFYFQTPDIRSLAIPMDLWRINSMIDQKTADPFIPLLEASQNNYRITGTALFSQNRMVGELSKEETQTFSLIRGTDVGFLTIPLGKNQHVAFANVRSKSEITPNMSSGDSLSFNVTVDIQGDLVETFPHREIGWQEKQEIERKAESLMKQEMESLIGKLQSLNTDPVGFAGKFRIAYPREWEDIDWNKVYPNAEITVDANFTVKETGLFR